MLATKLDFHEEAMQIVHVLEAVVVAAVAVVVVVVVAASVGPKAIRVAQNVDALRCTDVPRPKNACATTC
jgi:hypothetical protein